MPARSPTSKEKKIPCKIARSSKRESQEAKTLDQTKNPHLYSHDWVQRSRVKWESDLKGETECRWHPPGQWLGNTAQWEGGELSLGWDDPPHCASHTPPSLLGAGGGLPHTGTSSRRWSELIHRQEKTYLEKLSALLEPWRFGPLSFQNGFGDDFEKQVAKSWVASLLEFSVQQAVHSVLCTLRTKHKHKTVNADRGKPPAVSVRHTRIFWPALNPENRWHHIFVSIFILHSAKQYYLFQTFFTLMENRKKVFDVVLFQSSISVNLALNMKCYHPVQVLALPSLVESQFWHPPSKGR